MNSQFNPEMLVLGREMRGLTQSDLAIATSINQGLISRYENGVRSVSPHDLEKIAFVLDLPEAFFSRSGQIYGPETSSIYHRKRQSVGATPLKKMYARLNVLRMDVQKLLDGAEIETPYQFPKYNPADYDNDIAHIASMVRTAWRVPAGPIQSLVTLIENAGGIILTENLGSLQVDAIVQWIPPGPPIFLVNSQVPGDRLRFTLAHEIGHLVMHPQPVKDMEEEANDFASAFLMPAKDVLPDLDPVTLPRLAQLKPKWKVSIQALLHRAFDLRKITERKYRSLTVEFNKMGYKMKEPLPIAIEQPSLIKELLEIHMSAYNYTIAELSQLVTMSEWELQTLYLMQKPEFRIINSLPKITRKLG